MRLTRTLALLVIAGGIGGAFQIQQGVAQGLIAQPAEFPPATFAGKQYVDSRGCMFIRAGIDGDVSWVPRVTRDRQMVCGFEPTLARQTPAPVSPQIVFAPEPAPVDVVTVEPSPVITPIRPEPVVVAASPAPVVRQATIQKAPRPVAEVPLRTVRGDAVVTGKTRILPRHLLADRLSTQNVRIPKGYRPVWTDDRLNPHRAEQNLEGRAQMLLVWTNTVPRRLVNKANGRDVTASVPLVYPYTNISTQRRELGEVMIVQRNGQTVKQIIRKPVYSSRSAPARTQQTVARQKQYVQIGTFGTMDAARQAADNVARLGLPARIGKRRSAGTTTLSVQAGPFVDVPRRKAAVSRLRKAGIAVDISR